MSPRTVIRVVGHRDNGPSMLESPRFTEGLNVFQETFSEVLAQEIGYSVAEKMNSGRWWNSRSKRFGYYRSWVKTRYGSDRARQSGVRMRRADDSSSRVNLTQDEISEWGNIQHAMVRWMLRKLKSASVKGSDRSGKSRVYITGLTTGSQHIEITGAVNYLDRVMSKHESMTDGAKLTARQRRLRNLEEALRGGNGNLRYLKQTRYGQRLYRMAELAAIREVREKMAKRAQTAPVNDTRKRTKSAGKYLYGVQTGRLKNAWENAEYVLSPKGGGFRVGVFPNKAGDTLKNGGSLMAALKSRTYGRRRRNILDKRSVTKAIRVALEESMDESAAMGMPFRIKRKRG